MVQVELSGLSRAPAANLFTFTDVRGRHFVAMSASCEPAVEGVRACKLEIPDGYQNHVVTTLTLHVRTLKSRTIAAPPDEVAAAWAAAVTAPGAQPGPAAGAAQAPPAPSNVGASVGQGRGSSDGGPP
jgi:hypothetical protein